MKKKIIIFNPSLEDGGVEKNLFLVSNYLNSEKYLIEVLTCNNDKLKKFSKGIKFIGTKNTFWQNRNRKIKYLICLKILFFNLLFRSDRPLIFAFQANIYAVLVAKILNVKIRHQIKPSQGYSPPSGLFSRQCFIGPGSSISREKPG